RPGRTTATHSSGLPLPWPMRVSAGFFEIGLSGKMRMYSFPPRLTWREIAMRAASIWREVTNPHDSACSPNSPKESVVAPLEMPRIFPFCCLRHLTFFGANIVEPSFLSGQSLSALRKDLALEDP